MTSELVCRLIAANEGSQKPEMGGDLFYLAAERIAFLESKADELESSRILSEVRADDYWRLITEAREALQTIYANYGEDQRIESICRSLIDELA